MREIKRGREKKNGTEEKESMKKWMSKAGKDHKKGLLKGRKTVKVKVKIFCSATLELFKDIFMLGN